MKKVYFEEKLKEDTKSPLKKKTWIKLKTITSVRQQITFYQYLPWDKNALTFNSFIISEMLKKLFSNLGINLVRKLLVAAKKFGIESVEYCYNNMFKPNPKILILQIIQTKYILNLPKNYDVSKAARKGNISGR